MLSVAPPALPRMDDSSAEPPPRRDWLELYGRLVPPAVAPRARWSWSPSPAKSDADGAENAADAADDAENNNNNGAEPDEISELQRRLPDEVLLNVLSRLGGADAPYALASVAGVCRHFRLLAAAPTLWERAAWLAFTAPAFQAGLGRRAGGATEEEEQDEGGRQQQQAEGVYAVAHAVWAPANQRDPPRRRRAPPLRLPAAPPAAAAFASGPAAVQRLLATQHRGSWRDLYLSTPRPRSDGFYCSRNTYVRQGVRELRSASGSQTCHLVAYFRYWHFLPRSGRLVYRTSPLPPTRVARGLRELAAAVERQQAGGVWGGAHEQDGDWAGVVGGDGGADDGEGRPQQQNQQQQQQSQQQHALVGRYAVRGTALLCAVSYPNTRRTEIRTRLALRGTTPGAWNRLDVRSIESFDREDGTSAALDGSQRGGQEDEEEEDEDDNLWQAALGTEAAASVSAAARRMHRRGLNPAVFVPWGEVHTTRLNEPPSRMDVFIPG